MKTILILFLFCTMPFTVHAFDWDTQDTVLQALVITSLAIDRHQSNQPVNGQQLEETGWARNFIGNHPTRKQNDLYFLGAGVGHTLLALAAPKHWIVANYDIPVRTIWQSFWLGVEVGTIHSNYQLGLSIGFN